MADKKFEPHMMYDAQKAETKKEHLELKEDGYSHSKSGFKMKGYTYPGQSPMAKKCNCWKGYERVPGTKPCADKSCREK